MSKLNKFEDAWGAEACTEDGGGTAGLGLEGTYLGHLGCSKASLALVTRGDLPWS